MTVVDLSNHRRFKPSFPSVPLPDCLVACAKVIGIPIGNPAAFRFRRKGGRAEIWLHFNEGLRLNLSATLGIRPKDIVEARAWALDFAQKHGFKAKEIVAAKAKRGSLTKIQRICLSIMINRQERHWRHWTPSRADQRQACDALARAGLVSETILHSNHIYVDHSGAWHPVKSYLATPAGRERIKKEPPFPPI